MSFKILHSFTIPLEKEVEKIETRNEGGQEITVKTKVKEAVPHEIVLKEPSRRERQDISLFYGVSQTEAVNKGLLPKVIIRQKFLKSDEAVGFTQDEDKNLAKIYQRISAIQTEYMGFAGQTETDAVNAKKESLNAEYTILLKNAEDIESSYSSIFAHTSENYAQNKTLTWMTLFLSFVKNGDKFEPLFKGDKFETKEDSLSSLEDANDELYLKSVEKLSLYWYLYFNGKATKKEHFEELEAKYAQQAKKDDAKEAPPVETPFVVGNDNAR